MLLAQLNALPREVCSEVPPSIVWILESSGIFSVKSLARELIRRKFVGLANFPSETVWIKCAPPRVACFVWQVAHESISTIDNLIRRGFHFLNRCIMCKVDNESIPHLFWNYSFASQVWSYFSSRLSLFGPFPEGTRNFLLAWKGMNCDSRFAGCVKVLLHGILWAIWGERNNKIFRDEEANVDVVRAKIIVLVSRWCVSGGAVSEDRAREWARFCRQTADPGRWSGLAAVCYCGMQLDVVCFVVVLFCCCFMYVLFSVVFCWVGSR
ncbi:hypothetical protein LINPERHAP1_LOCUS10424 [Linum perenne]